MIRRSIRRRALVAIGLAVILTAGLMGSVSAHESREVGDYQLVVGFVNEPAVVDELNGIQLNVSRISGDGEEGEPVPGVDQTLQATIMHGEETQEVELSPVFGQDGSYTADVIPTSTGSYSFQFVGEIEGQEIDETFRSGPETFSDVQARGELEFPASATASAGTSGSDQAAAFGIAGVVAGLLGLLAGGVAYFKVSNTSSGRGAAARRQQTQQNSEQG